MKVVKIGGVEYNADVKMSKTEFYKIHKGKPEGLYERVYGKKKKDSTEE